MKYNFYVIKLGNFSKTKPIKKVEDGRIHFGKYKNLETIKEVVRVFKTHVSISSDLQTRMRWRRHPSQMACFAGDTLVAVSNGTKVTTIKLETE